MLINAITKTAVRIMKWRRAHLSDQAFLFILAVITGVSCGIAAALLKSMIACISRALTSWMHSTSANYILLAIPVAGIVLTGIYQRYVLRHNIEHGVRRIQDYILQNTYRLPGYLTYAPMIASSLTLGFGGSAGSEGPIATSGAAIGNSIGRLFRLDNRMLMIMIGCGAGAGIAGIFKAPAGGVLFTLEVLKLELTTVSVIALFLACITAAMTAYILSGCTVDMSFLQMEQFDASVIPWIILLGAVTGAYSLYYSDIMGLMSRLYDRIRNPWLKNTVSGMVLAALLFVFPAMYGEGYTMMGHLLNGDIQAITSYSLFHSDTSAGWPLMLIVAGIVLTKAFATSASNCGGGVAGDFAPALFAGCMTGYLFASTMNMLFGIDLPVSGFAFMGMAGVMSGVVRAPLMALFLTAEMTNGFILFLPLMAVSAISFGIVRIFRPESYYKGLK